VVNRIKKEHGMQQSIQRQLPAKAGNCVDAKPLATIKNKKNGRPN